MTAAAAAQKGMPDGPRSQHYATAFKHALEMTMATRVLPAEAVNAQQQERILDALANFCYDFFKAEFPVKTGETQEEQGKTMDHF